jgi:hypothetical protein
MIKELIKLADHLDKKGLRKEADYIDNILKTAENSAIEATFTNEKMKCINLLNGLGMEVSKGLDAFKVKRDALLGLKENGGKDIKEILKDFDNNLAGAYYFGVKSARKTGTDKEEFDKKIEAKFGISGTDAISKIKAIGEACSK